MPPSQSEFDIIRRYFQRPHRNDLLHLGNGDDCAVFGLPSEHAMAVSIDTLVAGRHFPDNAKPADIATRAFCVCLSDLAAMGAQPQYFTLALSLPEVDHPWLNQFSEALFTIADAYGCELIGGDTTKGSLSLSLQVHGTVNPAKMLRRDAAQIGDILYVTNTLGDGAAALSMLKGKQVFTSYEAYLEERFYCPEPQIQTGLLIADIAHAAIDVSDGLLADLQHIAHASKVDIAIDIEALPLSPACQSVDALLAQQWALTGGDDYQLAFTIAAHQRSVLEDLIANGQIKAKAIGRVNALQDSQPCVQCFLAQQPWQAPWLTQGFDHFAS